MVRISQVGARKFEVRRLRPIHHSGDLFSRSIREGAELAVSLEGSIRNMAVIDRPSVPAKSGNGRLGGLVMTCFPAKPGRVVAPRRI